MNDKLKVFWNLDVLVKMCRSKSDGPSLRIEERIQGDTININSKKFKETGEPYMDNQEWVESPQDKTIDKLQEAIDMIKEKLDEMK